MPDRKQTTGTRQRKPSYETPAPLSFEQMSVLAREVAGNVMDSPEIAEPLMLLMMNVAHHPDEGDATANTLARYLFAWSASGGDAETLYVDALMSGHN